MTPSGGRRAGAGRPRLMPRPSRVNLYLTLDSLARLDAARGRMSRSAYVRMLLASAVGRGSASHGPA